MTLLDFYIFKSEQLSLTIFNKLLLFFFLHLGLVRKGSSPKELAMIEGFKGPRVQGFKGKQ